MNEPFFLAVLLHGAAGAWDEIIPITIAVLTTVLGIVIFVIARRFRPEEEETEAGEDVQA